MSTWCQYNVAVVATPFPLNSMDWFQRTGCYKTDTLSIGADMQVCMEYKQSFVTLCAKPRQTFYTTMLLQNINAFCTHTEVMAKSKSRPDKLAAKSLDTDCLVILIVNGKVPTVCGQ